MSSAQQPPPPTPEQQAKHKHSAWLWVSLALIAACIGLFIWGAGKSSDLSDAKANNAKSTATLTSAYEDVNQSLGQTSEQLDQASSDVTEAQSAAEQVGSLLDGDDVRAQLTNVKATIQDITADCKASLGGT